MSLPEPVPPVLQRAYDKLDGLDQAALEAALKDDIGFPAELISHSLGRAGHAVSASTLRGYRRSLRRQAVAA